ncbi:two-component sensor histidine kinase [Roseovarius sp. SCSIO 43702]|uniref:ATP-binding protein n=1 Tax=Roseovarius sp. SCSIO 43702 TaxID=2823043 RepID=UPI001C7383D0|nr:ATP-binding protein [Roseovarius sp. SCSIO 43702]QYX55502.1 two-component sensor histidine kinase [Roseovarius sp. SCSIO 43702]
MSFAWLKRYMPRSLSGRALLILLLPVISVTLVVSVVSVQRLFEGVTAQMTRAATREIQLVLETGGAGEVADPLDIEFERVATDVVPETHQRRWYDVTGILVIRQFERALPELLAVELPDDSRVRMYFDQPGGPVALSFDRRRVSASNPHQLLVNMVVFGAIMTFVAYVYLRNQLRPITRLARAAEAFGRGRVVDYRPGGATEVRAAGSAFLDMRARIERQMEQRTLMLSGVSHDLRTPLTRLKLGLEMIEDEEARDMLRDVRDMERLLNEFLDFARGAAGDETTGVAPVPLIRRIVDDCARAGMDVTLGEVEGDEEVEIPLRESAIRRAVENLVSNAVRYGSRAEVSVAVLERSLRISVEDDGPGIPPESREEALKPFARLDPGRDPNKGGGVGLGLSIAMDVARSHGGALRLGESARLGGLRADIVIAR